MCHTETMECILQLDTLSLNRISTDNEINGNFGFTIQGPSFVSDVLMQPPVIGYLEPGGVAERYWSLKDAHSSLLWDKSSIYSIDLDRVFFNQAIVFLR